jgi:hypothetical protein
MLKLTKYILFSFFMKDFPSESFEIDSFKTWKSWRKYNLSFNNVHNIKKGDLVDLLTNDIFWLKKNNIISLDKKSLNKLLNQELLKLYKPENIELFWLKDPRKANLSEEEKEIYKIENFPKHVWIWLPHWSYKLPKITRREIIREVKEKVKNELNIEEYSKEVSLEIKNELKNIYRILKNFSDFWTTDVVNESNLIPKDQIFLAKYSRWATDPARKISDIPMNTDFYWNWLNNSIKSSHIIWWYEHAKIHIQITQFIDEVIRKYWGSIFIDRHDTWVNNMWKNSKLDKYDMWGFPIISLWTLDWDSCNNEIAQYYAERIEYHLWVKPLINSPYKGWYITQKHWRDKRKKIEEEWKNPWINNVIQIEVLKSLYLDEETQIIDKDKAEWIWVWLARAEIDVWLKFDKNYFNNLK